MALTPDKINKMMSDIDPVAGTKRSKRGTNPKSKANLNPRGNPNWQPGHTSPYVAYLSKLTPEEREEHFKKRREGMVDKTMRQNMIDLFKEYSGQWTVMLEQATVSVINKAIEQGDPQALNSVWDRVVGRPDTVMDVKVKQDDDVNEVLQKLQSTVVAEVNAQQIKQDKE